MYRDESSRLLYLRRGLKRSEEERKKRGLSCSRSKDSGGTRSHLGEDSRDWFRAFRMREGKREGLGGEGREGV